MNSHSYKLIVCATRFYQEIDLHPDKTEISIGTDRACDVRFGEDRLPEQVRLSVISHGDTWRLICSEQISIMNGDEKTTDSYTMQSGDRIDIVDSKTYQKLFSLLFFISFELLNTNYDCMIKIDGKNEFIVAKDGDIRIDKTIIYDDEVRLHAIEEGLDIDARLTEYGIHVNGILRCGDSILIKNGDFFAIRGVQFFLNDGILYTASDERIQSDFSTKKVVYQNNHLIYPHFVRSVRQRFVLPNTEPEILDPKPLPEKPEANIIVSFLPAILSVVLILAMRSSMGGSEVYMIYSAAMMGIGVVTSVITYKTASRKYNLNIVKRESDYRDYLSRKEEEIIQLRNQEYEISCYEAPSVEENIRHIADFDVSLFHKRPEHEDYLLIRIGDGVVHTKRHVKYRMHEYFSKDDYLEDYPESISKKYEMIQRMPVCIDMSRISSIGFVGERNKLYQMLKNIVISLSAEHFYQNVKFYFVLDENDIEYFIWTRWCRNAQSGNESVRNYIYDEESEKVILEMLYEELLRRKEVKGNKAADTDIVVFVYRSHRITKHPIIEMVRNSREIRCTFLFFEEYEELLNENCEQRIFLSKDENTGYIQDVKDGIQIQNFNYPHIPHDMAAKAMLKLGCVTVDEVDLEEKLPNNVSFFHVLNILSVKDLDLEKQWERTNVRESLTAPIGVRSGGDIVALDIHEKASGPHGLVAGTTGSGKSELLQTYLLSLATMYHPYEVNFVIIDFKGGGMANQFQNLPHMNCAITNIDGKEINRSLLSIRAELLRRQELFSEYGVNHIDDYIEKYKQKKVSEALPHLILVVDEFAELKSEQPEFMKELISTARIGRSLGVHLILATQKPSGVVNDQIWSNSRFKLCLKVQSTSDSNEILKSPLAAEIREVGRAYLQVGNNELFQLFQSAYSGAPIPDGSMGESCAYKISQIDLCGHRKVIYERKPMEEGNISQLEAMVMYIKNYCDEHRITKLPSICMPALPLMLPYTELSDKKKDKMLDIGKYDAPERQYQGAIEIDLTGHIYIVGASRMGKTNLLEVIIRRVTERYTPEELRISILDYGSQVLKGFEDLCHIDEIILPGAEDEAEALLERMEQSLQIRKTRLANMGLSSYSAYAEAGENKMPQQILMIDNITAFREMNSRQEDRLLHIVREGSAVGICIIATSQQTGGFGYRYLSNFSRKIALYCIDSGEYASAFERCRIKLDQKPGRCIIESDRELYEGQLYNAFPAKREIDRNQEIRDFINKTNEKYEKSGKEEETLKEEFITEKDLREAISGEDRSLILPIGRNEETGEIDTINLKSFDLLAVCGERDAMQYLENTIRMAKREESMKDYRITVIGNGVNGKKIADEYISSMEEAEIRLLEICEGIETEDIYQCIIMQHPDIYEYIENKSELNTMLESTMQRYGGKKINLILLDPPNESVIESKYRLIRMLDNSNHFMILSGLKENKRFELSMEMKKKYANKKKEKNEMLFKSGSYTAKYRVMNGDME